MVKVKICGLKKQESVDTAIAYGADYLGFVFVESSPRYITFDDMRRLNITHSFVKRVGVFVNPKKEIVEKCFKDNLIDIAQFHGQETKEFLQQFPRDKIWKAVRTDEAWFDYPVDCLLIDAKQAGSGEVCDWQKAAQISYKKFLAGGLNIHNIRQAIDMVTPFGVDISSGVEDSLGVKSNQKIKELLLEIKK